MHLRSSRHLLIKSSFSARCDYTQAIMSRKMPCSYREASLCLSVRRCTDRIFAVKCTFDFIRTSMLVFVLLILFVEPAGVFSDAFADGTWLSALYNATSGSGWNAGCRSGWNVSNPATVCTASWYGVQCNASNSSGVVTAVDLNNCNLRGGPLPDVPTSASDSMQYCRTLNLYSNGITGTLLSAWSRMSSVTTLSLFNNSLTGSLPASWSSMRSLQSLYLHTNSIAGTLQSSWNNMSSLQVLDLHYNSLTGSLPAAWINMPSLQFLGLNTNGLSGTLHSSWSSMPSMKFLSLHFNSLSGPLPTSWSSMPSMKELSMYANKLSGTLPHSWSSLSLLTGLNLAYNSLTGTLPAAWYTLVPFQNSFYDLTYNYFFGDIPQSWLWSNATISGNYFTSNCLNVSNMSAVSASGRFFNFGGTPRSNPLLCEVIGRQQAVAASPTPSKSSSTETWTTSVTLSTPRTDTASVSLTQSRSPSVWPTSTASHSGSSSQSISTSPSTSTSSTRGTQSGNKSHTEKQYLPSQTETYVYHSNTPSLLSSSSLAEMQTTSTSPSSMHSSSMTETVTNTLSDTRCMFPSPMHRFVKQVTIPDLHWTVVSNGDSGEAIHVGDPFLKTFSDLFSSSSSPLNENLALANQRHPDLALAPSADFILTLSSHQYAAYDMVGRRIVAALNARLSVDLTVTAVDKLRLRYTFDGGALPPMYVSQTATVNIDFASFVCFDHKALTYVPNVTISLMFAGAPLVVPLSAISVAATATSIVSIVSCNPTTAAVTSRLTLLSGYIDCTFDPLQGGKALSLAGYHYGESAGQYLRGAVVGNVALLYSVCLALATLSVVGGCVIGSFRKCRRGASIVGASRMILDMMHVPSVFTVPLSMTLQPTVTAAVQLIFVRAGGGSADVVVAALGLLGVMVFVIFFSVALLQEQPWFLEPRSAASLAKRLKVYGSAFFWLSGKQSRIRDTAATAAFNILEAREHWAVRLRSDASKRAKRRLLMLFEDTRCMWFPVLDLWTSMAIALIAGLAPLNSVSVCFAQLVATSAVFVALILVAVIARPLLSSWGNSYLVFVNVCNVVSTLSLLANNIHASGIPVSVATLSLMINGLVAALVSVPVFVRLLLRFYSSIKRVIGTFAPPKSFESGCDPKLVGDSSSINDTGRAAEQSTYIADIFCDTLVLSNDCVGAPDDLESGDGMNQLNNEHSFIRNLLLTFIVDRAMALSDECQVNPCEHDAGILIEDFVASSWHQQMLERQQEVEAIAKEDDDVVQLLMALQVPPELAAKEDQHEEDSESFLFWKVNPLEQTAVVFH